MADNSGDDLSYGQIGEATYDVHSQRWHFPRIPAIRYRWKPMGPFKTTLQPTLVRDDSITRHSDSPNLLLRRSATSYPELVPSIPLLAPLERLSHTIINAACSNDLMVSDLFAFGKALDLDRKRTGKRRAVDVVTVAGGYSREAIRLVRLRKDHLGWKDEKKIEILSPSVSSIDSGWWIGNGEPIQQVAFSENRGGSGTWLAIRQSTTTTILQPVLRETPASALRASVHAQPQTGPLSSRLQLENILVLPINETGGTPHADVAFNFCNQLQFAVTDRQGRWSVWDVDERHREKHVWTANPGPSGYIYGFSTMDQTSPADHEDGWGKITWAAGGSRLVVASRRKFAMYDAADGFKPLDLSNLCLVRGSDWILDMKGSPLNDGQIFLVTSSRLFWLNVLRSGNKNTRDDSNLAVELLCCWRHFRSPEDFSLRLCINGRMHETIVLLYSRWTSLVTTFTFAMSQPSLAFAIRFPMSISDPFLFPLLSFHDDQDQWPNSATSHLGELSVSTLALMPIGITTSEGFDSSFLGLGNIIKKTMVFKLFLLSKDLGVREQIFVLSPDEIPDIPLPHQIGSKKTTKTPAVISDDRFIAPNGPPDRDEEDYGIESDFALNRPNPVDAPAQYTEDPFTTNIEWLHRELRDATSTTLLSRSLETSTFDGFLNHINQGIIEKSLRERNCIETLFELSNEGYHISDMDDATSSLHKFLDSLSSEANSIGVLVDSQNGNQQRSNFCSLVPTTTSGLLRYLGNPERPQSLLDIYQDLVRYWITPLPPDIPGRVRLAISKVLRKIALDLRLSTIGARINQSKKDTNASSQPASFPADEQLNLPVRPKIKVTNLSSQEKSKNSAQFTPAQPSSQISEDVGFMPSNKTPESSTPAVSTAMTFGARDSYLSSEVAEGSACQRLRTLVNLKPQPPLPTVLENTLNHWTVGANPADYDWETAQYTSTVHIRDEALLESQAANRERRRQERYQRQQIRNQSSSLPQTIVPVIQSSQLNPAQTLQDSSQPLEKRLSLNQKDVEMPSKLQIPFKKTEQIKDSTAANNPRKKKKKKGF